MLNQLAWENLTVILRAQTLFSLNFMVLSAVFSCAYGDDDDDDVVDVEGPDDEGDFEYDDEETDTEKEEDEDLGIDLSR